MVCGQWALPAANELCDRRKGSPLPAVPGFDETLAGVTAAVNSSDATVECQPLTFDTPDNLRHALCGGVTCPEYCLCDVVCYDRPDTAEAWGVVYTAWIWFGLVSWLTLTTLSLLLLNEKWKTPEKRKDVQFRITALVAAGGVARLIWLIDPKETLSLLPHSVYGTPFRVFLVKFTQATVLITAMLLSVTWSGITRAARKMRKLTDRDKERSKRRINAACLFLAVFAALFEGMKIAGINAGLFDLLSNMLFSIYMVGLAAAGAVYGVKISVLLSRSMATMSESSPGLVDSQTTNRNRKLLSELRKVRNFVLGADAMAALTLASFINFTFNQAEISAHLILFVGTHTAEVGYMAVMLGNVWHKLGNMKRTSTVGTESVASRAASSQLQSTVGAASQDFANAATELTTAKTSSTLASTTVSSIGAGTSSAHE